MRLLDQTWGYRGDLEEARRAVETVVGHAMEPRYSEYLGGRYYDDPTVAGKDVRLQCLPNPVEPDGLRVHGRWAEWPTLVEMTSDDGHAALAAAVGALPGVHLLEREEVDL